MPGVLNRLCVNITSFDVKNHLQQRKKRIDLIKKKKLLNQNSIFYIV